jgi:hypothetical protein
MRRMICTSHGVLAVLSLAAMSPVMAQSCLRITLDNLSPVAFACFRDTIPQHRMRLVGRERGQLVAFGGEADYRWNESSRVLTIDIQRLPEPGFLRKLVIGQRAADLCGFARMEIEDFAAACRRTSQVRLIKGDATHEQWRIDNPDVRRPEAQYREIVFRGGDSVSIEAGGCVQSGGHGRTWLRYLGNPTNKIHYATARLPGMSSLERLRSVLSRTLKIPRGIEADPFLHLGYVDDDYSDNGYWGHDDGPDNQCKDEKGSFVEVTIRRAAVTP